MNEIIKRYENLLIQENICNCSCTTDFAGYIQ